MEYVELGKACDDCAVAIANDDYSGMSAEQEAATKAGFERINQILIVGVDLGFCHSGCNVCGSRLSGGKHEVGYLRPAQK